MKKIRIDTAKKLYNSGRKIYIVPCKIRCSLENLMFMPAILKLEYGFDFNEFVNEYEYYNCSSYAGKHAAFYIDD